MELIDADGAVRENARLASDGSTRVDFLRKAGLSGAGFAAGGVLFTGLADPASAAISSRRRSRRNDVKILNYALTLEYLESEFYARAVAGGAIIDPVVRRFAEVVAEHEATHVRRLRAVLGKAAIKKPSFDFGDAVSNQVKFRATAQVLEDVGVSAYAGQGPNLVQRRAVVVALSIHSVEARHAAWIRFINAGSTTTASEQDLPAPVAFDQARTEKQVLKLAGPYIA